MSGRSAPSPVWIVLCSTKSQWETMPAISTTLRSWISPQEPRVEGRLSARDEVAGLAPQRADALAELADHLRELALGLAALALQAPDLALHARELLLHGRDDALDLLGALRHLAGRALLLGAARLGDAARQRGAGLLHHVERERLQLLAQARGCRGAARTTAASAPIRTPIIASSTVIVSSLSVGGCQTWHRGRTARR